MALRDWWAWRTFRSKFGKKNITHYVRNLLYDNPNAEEDEYGNSSSYTLKDKRLHLHMSYDNVKNRIIHAEVYLVRNGNIAEQVFDINNGKVVQHRPGYWEQYLFELYEEEMIRYNESHYEKEYHYTPVRDRELFGNSRSLKRWGTN